MIFSMKKVVFKCNVVYWAYYFYKSLGSGSDNALYKSLQDKKCDFCYLGI